MDGTDSPRTPTVKRRILIADDHQLLRHALTALIQSESGLAVCAEAATCRAAIEAVRETRPDLVIVDLALGDGDGVDVIESMKEHHPEIPALVLSMHDESSYAERALSAGARAYVTKQEMGETLLGAIRCVLGGGRYVSARLRGGRDVP